MEKDQRIERERESVRDRKFKIKRGNGREIEREISYMRERKQ